MSSPKVDENANSKRNAPRIPGDLPFLLGTGGIGVRNKGQPRDLLARLGPLLRLDAVPPTVDPRQLVVERGELLLLQVRLLGRLALPDRGQDVRGTVLALPNRVISASAIRARATLTFAASVLLVAVSAAAALGNSTEASVVWGLRGP